MIAELIRLEQSDQGTIGVLRINKRILCVTLERPYKENAPNISCIPTGVYTCRRKKSPTFGQTYEMTGVHGRSHILFHAGNYVTDSSGCILVGRRVADNQGRRLITDSRSTFRQLMEAADGIPEFKLVITENY